MAYFERAEREFKIAESETATGLGYKICHQHFPPVIILSKDDKNWECPECHNTKHSDDYNSVLGIFLSFASFKPNKKDNG